MTVPKPPSEPDEQREQEKWYERSRYQVLLLTIAGMILFWLTWWILDWYVGPASHTEKLAVLQTVVVLVGGAVFLFGLSFIAQYLQVPHYGVIAVTFLVVVTVLWVLVQPETADQRIGFFQTVGGIVGGSALLFGLYFTAQTLQVNREGQITDRFTRAIDQLGATDDMTGKPRREVRLGGIYALERIARDSLERDYSTVIEVLTAYIRENTSQAPGPSEGFSQAVPTPNEGTADAEGWAEQTASPGIQRPTADIQAILDVLSRTQARVPKEYRTRLDLHQANLQGAILQGIDLRRANLRGVNLQVAYLQGADLQGAILDGANFLGANLRETNFQGAHLPTVILEGADLRGANFQEAHLVGAILGGARLREANLRNANLQGVDLQGAVLSGTNLQGAYLQGANVTDKQLADTLSLQGATMPDGSVHC